MATRFVNGEPVPERVGWRYSGELTDEDGLPIEPEDFNELTVRIWVLDDDQTNIIGTPVSILNVGRGTLTAGGILRIYFTPDDSVMQHPLADEERHIALVEGIYAINRQYAREIEWIVTNLSKR
jgi:hypothetical protein